MHSLLAFAAFIRLEVTLSSRFSFIRPNIQFACPNSLFSVNIVAVLSYIGVDIPHDLPQM